MKVIFVRHGQTDKNADQLYLGHYNAPLNDRGREQINSLVHSLIAETKIEYLYCSDLLRATQSAEIIGNYLGLKPITYQALRELNFGNWDLCTFHEIWESHRQDVEEWISDPYNVAPPKGETLNELGERIDNWLKTILFTKHLTDNVMIVSHGGPIRWFQSKWLLNDKTQFWNVENIKHGDGLVVTYDPKSNCLK